MGRVIFDTAASLNGFIADGQNSLEWLFAVEGGEEPDAALIPTAASVLVEGSTTYEWLLDHDDILLHPEKWHAFHVVGQFFDAGALDEIAVSFAPVLLAGGAPLLPRRIEADRLRLKHASAVGQFARVVYSVDAAPTPEPA